ncbi:DNA polymerase III subunit epsilon [Paracoccus marinus]|uniref:DNA polymerase III subunit epsilon n=1 Tax=Paracoccus marinus TaxID=288426 RepID=UPI00103A8A18|nr:DNA polymerase III subunit epsilon [Paracoccus marinus]
MREIVFDTETTGFDPATGDRVVEIGAIELINHLPTKNHFHVYLNPDRAMPAEALAVHGLGDDFLRDKPRFAEVADRFLDFIGPDARLIAHNADFDIRFLNAELRLAKRPELRPGRALDTAAMARQKFPGAPASLDALCRRFGVDNSGRDLHGALLDSELLAAVYLELIGGRQPDLVLDAPAVQAQDGVVLVMAPRRARPVPLPPRLTTAEVAAHAAFVARMGDKALWLRYTAASG